MVSPPKEAVIVLPKLGSVPSIAQDHLCIKASHTGITFLQERKYRKRYTGSKYNAVDINGGLCNAKELEAEIRSRNEVKKSGHKKKQNCSPSLLLLNNIAVENNDTQISEENSNTGNFATNIARSSRKKSYTVNKKEVRQRLLGYINTQKGRKELYFWTVTFPEGTPDDACYQAFNTWLTSLRKYGMLKDYLWVAERQLGDHLEDPTSATNTIHFHIAIPHYMNVQRANAMMRGTLKNLAKAGAIPYKPHSRQIIKYNGVDIAKHRATRRVTNFAIKKGARALAVYLTKYVTKNDTSFDHLAWHNSRGFSALFTAITFTVEEFKKFGFSHFLNRVRIFKMNFATFVPWLYGPPPLLLDHLFQLNSYIQHINDVEPAKQPAGKETGNPRS